MDPSSQQRNPLIFIFAGLIVMIAFDFRFYFVRHHLMALGTVIIFPMAFFAILFLRRSHFAWHLAVIIIAVVVPVSLLVTYRRGYMNFPLSPQVAIIDLVIIALLLAYLWKIRKPYFRYLDVWQRKITAVEDSHLREDASDGPDTKPRS